MAANGGTKAAGELSQTQKEADIQMMLSADVHLGTKNCDYQMERYVFKRRNDGIYIINLGKTWEKLQMAARVIVAIENPKDIIVQSARPYGQRAVLKFAQYTGTLLVPSLTKCRLLSDTSTKLSRAYMIRFQGFGPV
uniref:40S ribosomal protein Sa-2 n=1 Tax=Noccaea caerulescens TaxID=107243 RepID=A0A1J3KAQ9_NOCCA